MHYIYHYFTSEGKRRKAVVEAASLAEAREKLHLAGTYVISLKARQWGRRQEHRLNRQQLALFTSQLSHLLIAGIPLYESLLSLQEQYAQERFLPVIESLAEEIKRGSLLAKAMKRFPTSFDLLYCSMVEAGEAVGHLAQTLKKLADLLNRQNRLKKQLITTLLYPLILTCFSLFLVVILLTYVVPSLEVLFVDQEVNRFTRAVFGFSHLVTRGWPFGCFFLILLCIGVLYLKRLPAWRRYGEELLLKVPLVKRVKIDGAMARFSRTMSTLLEGGVSMINALQISRHVMQEPLIEEEIAHAEQAVIEGSQLSSELQKSKWIPPLVPRMLAIAEEGGNSSTMLGQIASVYEEETEKLLLRIASLAQPIILLVLGLIVGLIMLAILLPLTDVSGFISGGF